MILTPPNHINHRGEVIFLAGPIQGASRWQDEVATVLDCPHVVVASPLRQSFDDDGFDFDEQVDWESKWLRKASESGVIFFYLAPEISHSCDRAFAQTTRFELGEWLALCHGRVVIATHPDFSGLRYIRRRIETHYPGAVIVEGLLNGCAEVKSRLRP